MVDRDYDTILVPTDGSEGALAAAEHAIGLAERYDATIHVLAVVDVDDVALTTPTDTDLGDLKSTLRTQAQADIDEVVSLARAEGRETEEAIVPDTEEAILVGVPHRAIVDHVEDEGIDLVVMGTHGRQGLQRVLLGSVAERVVRTSPAPVMTIRPTEDEDEA
ncbi:universal stress protein [Halorientalis pallida]|uniref:Universal stress protein n=1 Tax=Halorientalis pallida TaxID=2479928 RepID=A0A498L0G4_9EURY|nr:universal stress protein [Halorientalis pallida]RXK48544.1 universal stress protein [Halorientalis pallida]